jgi:hypothetical protein
VELVSLLGLQLRVENHRQVLRQVDCSQLKCLELVSLVPLVSLLLLLLLELLLFLVLVWLLVVVAVFLALNLPFYQEELARESLLSFVIWSGLGALVCLLLVVVLRLYLWLAQA